MSVFGIRHRLQEGEGNGGGGGGDGGGGDWRAAFGTDGATALKDFKEPGDFLKAFSTQGSELTTLKGATPPTFDWRKELGGEDQEAQKLLGRYTDPKAFYKAHTEAVGKIRSGELAFKPLDMKAATADQIKEFRVANGIPLDVKGYFEKLPDGMVIGKDDLPVMTKYAEALHTLNAPPAVMHALAGEYYKQVEAAETATQTQDRQDKTNAEAALKKVWGHDFGANKAVVLTLLDELGGDLKGQFLDATLPNGKRLMNEPAVAQFLAALALEKNPLAHLVPNGGEGDMRSLESEIAEIEKLMKTDRPAYNQDEKKQARLRQLYDMREKVKSKAA